jgi:sigma-70-like protein
MGSSRAVVGNLVAPAATGTDARWARLLALTKSSGLPDASAASRADMEGFEQLFRRHERDIFTYLWRMTGDEHAAYDLAQETFIRACRRSCTSKATRCASAAIGAPAMARPGRRRRRSATGAWLRAALRHARRSDGPPHDHRDGVHRTHSDALPDSGAAPCAPALLAYRHIARRLFVWLAI